MTPTLLFALCFFGIAIGCFVMALTANLSRGFYAAYTLLKLSFIGLLLAICWGIYSVFPLPATTSIAPHTAPARAGGQNA